MHGKKIYLLIVLFLLSCSNNDSSNKNHEEDKFLGLKDSSIGLEQLEQAEKRSAESELLSNSIELPSIGSNFTFTPWEIVNNKVYGYTTDLEATVGNGIYSNTAFAYLDIDTQIYHFIEKNEDESIEAAIFSFIQANENYVLYAKQEVKGVETSASIKIYNLQTAETKEIYSLNSHNQLFRWSAEFVDDSIYINLPNDPVNEEDEYDPGLYIYDIANEKLSLLKDGGVYRVKMYNSILYWISYRDDSSYLISYNPKTKREEVLVKVDGEETLYDIEPVNGEILMSVMNESHQSEDNNYLYNIEEKKIKTFIQNSIMGAIECEDTICQWQKGGEEEGSRPKTYLYDMKNDIYYDYEENLVHFSETGIIWVRFNKNNDEIPPGQIFYPGNSTIMYKKYNFHNSGI